MNRHELSQRDFEKYLFTKKDLAVQTPVATLGKVIGRYIGVPHTSEKMTLQDIEPLFEEKWLPEDPKEKASSEEIHRILHIPVGRKVEVTHQFDGMTQTLRIGRLIPPAATEAVEIGMFDMRFAATDIVSFSMTDGTSQASLAGFIQSNKEAAKADFEIVRSGQSERDFYIHQFAGQLGLGQVMEYITQADIAQDSIEATVEMFPHMIAELADNIPALIDPPPKST